MAERRDSSLLKRAASFGAVPPRARESAGFWDRPALLNLVADLLLLFAFLATAYAAVAWVLNRPLFPVREVIVTTPPAQVTTAQIEFAARSAIRGNFFSVSLEEVRLAFEKLPWVRRAEVRRSWPDVLELRLEEHQAVAYWRVPDSEAVQLVNRQGEVFVASSNAAMPEFSGPQGSAAFLLARHQAWSEMVAPLQRRLTGLWLSAREAWRLQLDDGMVIVLGREQERAPLEQRLARFVATWPQAREKVGVQVAVADLRYPRGYALTPSPLAQEPKGMQ